MAEDVYGRLNQLRDQVKETQRTVVETRDRVDDVERELAEQRAIVEALAEQRGVDVDAVAADVHVADAEAAAAGDGSEAGDAADDAAAADARDGSS
jgi:peptidoglycan hydrolase CwlO-like protein